jgi:hypothetical protein
LLFFFLFSENKEQGAQKRWVYHLDIASNKERCAGDTARAGSGYRRLPFPVFLGQVTRALPRLAVCQFLVELFECSDEESPRPSLVSRASTISRE